ncbi:19201_t:CDS:2 [Dentiscutata erythropus]|uniref:19201_t:CDS:1 n=1 Tax=Dentiscutata erythropus TaxID=1348616 RepID=A0A9N8VW29_9GLOM|nr:19201_t:CDS:2 [Dentiscutata erythropus]
MDSGRCLKSLDRLWRINTVHFLCQDPQAPPQPQTSQPATPATPSTPAPTTNTTQNPAASNTTQNPAASNSTQIPAASNSTPAQIPAIASRPIIIFTDHPLYGKIGFNVTFTWKYDGQFDFLTKSLVAVAVYNSSTNKNWTIDSNMSTTATSATWVTSTIVNPSLIAGPYMFAIYNGSDYYSGGPVAPLAQIAFTMYQPGETPTYVGPSIGSSINIPTLITSGISLLTILFTYIQYNGQLIL